MTAYIKKNIWTDVSTRNRPKHKKSTQTNETHPNIWTHIFVTHPVHTFAFLKQMEHIYVTIRGKQPGIRLPSYLNSCVPTAAVRFMSHRTRLPYGTDPTRRHRDHLIGINWTHLSVQLAWSKTVYILEPKWIMGGNVGLIYPVLLLL